jgi:cholesterol transport system auxiliary component
MVRMTIIIALMLCSLTACSLFSPVAGTNTYLIKTLPENIPVHRPHAVTLLVVTPDSLPVYNTTDMAYTSLPYQISFFAKNSWAETPAQMIKPLLIETLQKTRHYRSVNSSEIAGLSDFILHTHILELQQVFTLGSSSLHLKIDAQLVKTNTGLVVASKMFEIIIPAQPTPYGGVTAANEAVAQMLEQITQFCLMHS